MQENSAIPVRRRFRWGRFFLILIAVAALGLFLLVQQAERMALGLINDELPRRLRAPARLGGVNLALAGGRVTLHDLRIGQPEGFGGEPLLRLERATVKVRPGSLRGGVIEVEEVVVDGLNAHLVKRADGTNMLLNLTAALMPAAPAPEAAPGGEPPPAVHVRKIRLNRVGLRFDDTSLAQGPLSVTVTNLSFSADGIAFAPAASNATAAAMANLRLEVTQPGGRPNAVLLAVARIGTLSSRIPPVDLVARLTGLSLRTAGPFYYPGMSTAFAGEATDGRLDLRLGGGATPEEATLRGHAVLTTSGGHDWPLPISGTLAKPELVLGELARAFPNLAGTAVSQVAGNATGAVMATAGGAARAVESGVTGVFRTVGALGGGVLKTAEKAVEGDLRGAVTGLGGTVADTTREAVGTVTSSGVSLADGLRDAASAATGAAGLDAWWSGVAERAAKAEREAAATLEKLAKP